MYLFPLFNVLPADIIRIIYLNCRKDSFDKLSTFCIIRKKKLQALSSLLRYTSYTMRYVNNHIIRISIIDRDCVESMKIVLKNDYSQSVYNHKFWQYLLEMMSKQLGCIDTYLLSTNLKNVEPYNKNFKLAVSTWFNLCKKYNIKLYTGTYLKFRSSLVTYENNYARNIKKIKNFNKFAFAPSIIFNGEKYPRNHTKISCVDFLEQFII